MPKDLIIRDSTILASKGILSVKHFFNTIEERDLYYNNTNNKKELTKNETVIAIRTSTPNVSDFYMWTGESNPDTYETVKFENITLLVQGADGENAYELLYRFQGDKLQIKSSDPTITEWVTSTSLKGIDGDNLEDAYIQGDNLIFNMRNNKDNSLKEIKIDNFIPEIKSNIVLGNYMGVFNGLADGSKLPKTDSIINGQWWKSATGNVYIGTKKINTNDIIIANKDTNTPTINDFDVFSGQLDEIISKSLYVLGVGNSSINQIKDIRLQVDDNGKLNISGYDSITNNYITLAEIAKQSKFESAIIKKALYLEETLDDGTVFYSRLIGSAVTPNSIAIGNSNRDLILVSKNPKIATAGVDGLDNILQVNPIYNASKQLSNYKTTITATKTRNIKNIQARITDNIGDYLVKVSDKATGEVVYTSRPENEYNNGLSKDYKLGSPTNPINFYSTENLYIREGRTYDIELKFANTVTMLGMNKTYMGEYNPNTNPIPYNIFDSAKQGYYWRISANGNVSINGVQYPVVAGNIIICLEDVQGIPSNFNSFGLENVDYPSGGKPVEFIPYQIYIADTLEFDEIAGKSYVDSVLKGGSDGEVYVKGNSSANNSILITTNQNNNNQIEFKQLTNATNKTYTDAIIKDINLGGKYPSLIQTIDGLKAGRTPKGNFDPTIDTLSKLADAKIGNYWQVTKDGTTTYKLYDILDNGVYKDILSQDGTKITRNVENVTFDGSVDENWTLGFVNTNVLSFGIPIPKMKKHVPNEYIIDVEGFVSIYDEDDSANWLTEGCATRDGIMYLMILKSKLSTLDVAGLRQYLASNNLKVKYALSTPIEVLVSNYVRQFKLGETILCVVDVDGTPIDFLNSFNIEPAPTFSTFVPNTSTSNGVGGGVPQSLAGQKKYLISDEGWGDLPILTSTTDGIVKKPISPNGNKFLCDDTTFKEIPVYIGATAIANGRSGMVKGALPTEKDFAYFGDNTWRPIISTTTDNYFSGNNTFGQQVFIDTNLNRPFVLSGTSGTPFNANNTEIYNLGGFVLHNSTVGTNNTTTFCATGNSFNNTTSDFVWMINDGTGGNTPPKQVLKLNSESCLFIGNQTNMTSIASLGRSIMAEKEIYCFGRVVGNGIRVTAKNRNVDCTIGANNITSTNQFLELPDETNATFATREWINSNVTSGIAPASHVIQTTTTTMTNSNKDIFPMDTMLISSTTSLALNQVYLRVGATDSIKYVQFSNIMQKFIGIGKSDIKSLLGSLLSSALTNTQTYKSGLSAQGNVVASSVSSSASSTTPPTSFFRIILGRDSTNIYYVNVGITSSFFIVEKSDGTWNYLSDVLDVKFRSATALTNGTGTVTNTLMNASTPAIQLASIRHESYV